MASVEIGLASAGVKPAPAAVEPTLTPPGATHLEALKKRLAQAPRRRDFKTVPMILDHREQWDDEALTEVLSYKPCAQAGLGQYRHRRPLAELHAQCAQYADLVVQTSGFPHGVGDPWFGASRALRSGDVGQVSPHPTGGRRVHNQNTDQQHEDNGGRSPAQRRER